MMCKKGKLNTNSSARSTRWLATLATKLTDAWIIKRNSTALPTKKRCIAKCSWTCLWFHPLTYRKSICDTSHQLRNRNWSWLRHKNSPKMQAQVQWTVQRLRTGPPLKINLLVVPLWKTCSWKDRLTILRCLTLLESGELDTNSSLLLQVSHNNCENTCRVSKKRKTIWRYYD